VEGSCRRVWCVALSKDGKGLVSGGDDKILKYWDVSLYADLGYGSASPIVNTSKVEEYKKEILRFEGHTVRSLPCNLVQTCSTHPQGYIRWIAFSSDDRWIFSTSPDERSTRIWDAKTATWQCTLKGHKDLVMELMSARRVNF
jgi:WD40 repeat protein